MDLGESNSPMFFCQKFPTQPSPPSCGHCGCYTQQGCSTQHGDIGCQCHTSQTPGVCQNFFFDLRKPYYPTPQEKKVQGQNRLVYQKQESTPVGNLKVHIFVRILFYFPFRDINDINLDSFAMSKSRNQMKARRPSKLISTTKTMMSGDVTWTSKGLQLASHEPRKKKLLLSIILVD